MVLALVKCPHCGSSNIKKNGTARNGKQRFLCCNEKCSHKTFVENYTHKAYEPNVRSQIFFSIVNGSGTRATARMLGIDKGSVTAALRSIEGLLWYVNYDYLNSHRNGGITVEVVPVNEVEMEEMWSFVGDKSQQYWLWWAIDHNTGEALAFYFGAREHKNLEELLALLSPFDISIVYSENDFAYKSCVTGNEVIMDKENTQEVERKHLSLKTWCSRLMQKGIRFSKDHRVHRIVRNCAEIT